MFKRLALPLTALTLALTLSLGALAVSPEAASAAPHERDRGNPAQFCKVLLEEGLPFFPFPRLPLPRLEFGSQGACVAFFAAENPTPLIVNFCQAQVAASDEGNTGQCIKLVRELFEEFFGEGLS